MHCVKTEESSYEVLEMWLTESEIITWECWSGIMNMSGWRWLFEFENSEDALAFKLRWG